MNIARWEPFRNLETMFDRYLPFFGRPVPRQETGPIEWKPAADISETDKEFLIKAELPEVKKQDVSVTVQDGAITISGERKQEKKQKGENEIRVETFYGAFARTFALPDMIDAAAIRAELKDGVLRVHIPKTETAAAVPTQVEVK